MNNTKSLFLALLCLLVSFKASALPPFFPKPLLDRTLVLDKSQRLSAPSTIEVNSPNGNISFPNKSKAITYYLRLNQKISQSNPILDAKRAFDLGQYIILSEKFEGGAPISTLVDFQRKLPRYQTYAKIHPKRQFRSLQGVDFLNDWYHRTRGRDNRILTIYGQSAIRYSYYWNRTMSHYLNCCQQ